MVYNCLDDNFYQRLNQIPIDGKNVVFYGATAIGRFILNYINKTYSPMELIFIDSSVVMEAERYGEYKVYPPEKLEVYDNYIVLLASSHVEAMEETLHQLGLKKEKNYYILADLAVWKTNVLKEFENKNSGKRKLSNAEQREVMLDILKKIKQLCEENGLRYYLDSGTLIGAVRHKGFIPWDDDIDLIMPLPDAKRLCELIQKEEYYLVHSIWNEKEWMYAFPRIGRKDTRTIELVAGNIYMENNITVDVYVLGGLGNTKEEAERTFAWHEEWWKKCETAFLGRPGYITAELADEIEKIRSVYKYDESRYVGSLFGLSFPRYYFQREDMEPHENMLFEGEYYPVPKNYDERLRMEYGDYMVIPDVQKAHRQMLAYYV